MLVAPWLQESGLSVIHHHTASRKGKTREQVQGLYQGKTRPPLPVDMHLHLIGGFAWPRPTARKAGKLDFGPGLGRGGGCLSPGNQTRHRLAG